MKNDEELSKKCDEIIDSLKGFDLKERFKIITSLHDSFISMCEEQGIYFIEEDRGIGE